MAESFIILDLSWCLISAYFSHLLTPFAPPAAAFSYMQHMACGSSILPEKLDQKCRPFSGVQTPPPWLVVPNIKKPSIKGVLLPPIFFLESEPQILKNPEHVEEMSESTQPDLRNSEVC